MFVWNRRYLNRLTDANGRGTPRVLWAGLKIRWWRGSPTWKARYEFEVKIGLVLWEFEWDGFIAHPRRVLKMSADERVAYGRKKGYY